MSQFLDSLLVPADLRKLTLADETFLRIRELVSRHGGHLASNLATVELDIALRRVFDSFPVMICSVGDYQWCASWRSGMRRTFWNVRSSHDD